MTIKEELKMIKDKYGLSNKKVWSIYTLISRTIKDNIYDKIEEYILFNNWAKNNLIKPKDILKIKELKAVGLKRSTLYTYIKMGYFGQIYKRPNFDKNIWLEKAYIYNNIDEIVNKIKKG